MLSLFMSTSAFKTSRLLDCPYSNSNSFLSKRFLEISNDLIKVYPNPSKGIYNINLISKSDISLNVFDLSGRLVFSNKLKNTNTIELDISDKLSGTYILKMVTDDLHYQKRIILTRE